MSEKPQRYTPKDFVDAIASSNDISEQQQAFLYGLVIGRLSAKNKTDGTIPPGEANRLVEIYNAMHEKLNGTVH